MYGCSDENVAAIYDGRFEAFAPREAALLRLADAKADTPSNVSQELYAELRRYFSEEQLIELAASAGLGHPTRTAVRSITSERRRCGTFAFWPTSHSLSTFTQKTRGTRAAIF